MRKYALLCCALAVIMITVPLISVRYMRVEGGGENISSESDLPRDTIDVMMSNTGSVKTLKMREYVIGSLSGEISASYHKEALKAQAVACYTFALYVASREEKRPEGADISDDSTVYQSYIDEDARKKKWGDDYEKNEKIMSEAVDEVFGQYLEYDGKPAMAAYHAMCSGKTESAANVWGKSVSYLKSTVSSGDKLAPNYETCQKVSADEFKRILFKKGLTYGDYPTDASKWIGDIERYDSGVVKYVDICGKKISGTDMRSLFSLKSADFDISFADGGFTFTCRGNGHFVGMSQYGADYMARQGSSYDEILNHYYPGTVLKKL
ncbi:MAG: stage II sporulation protein D [Oscillospiraceae bacterium]|nr:stage II sporulation protein D [Oscillospiraceae bacterium]